MVGRRRPRPARPSPRTGRRRRSWRRVGAVGGLRPAGRRSPSRWALAGQWSEVVDRAAPTRSPLVLAGSLGPRAGRGVHELPAVARHACDARLAARRCGPAARLFFVTQLGKYLPGAVWPVLAQMRIGREHGDPAAADGAGLPAHARPRDAGRRPARRRGAARAAARPRAAVVLLGLLALPVLLVAARAAGPQRAARPGSAAAPPAAGLDAPLAGAGRRPRRRRGRCCSGCVYGAPRLAARRRPGRRPAGRPSRWRSAASRSPSRSARCSSSCRPARVSARRCSSSCSPAVLSTARRDRRGPDVPRRADAHRRPARPRCVGASIRARSARRAIRAVRCCRVSAPARQGLRARATRPGPVRGKARCTPPEGQGAQPRGASPRATGRAAGCARWRPSAAALVSAAVAGGQPPAPGRVAPGLEEVAQRHPEVRPARRRRGPAAGAASRITGGS